MNAVISTAPNYGLLGRILENFQEKSFANWKTIFMECSHVPLKDAMPPNFAEKLL